MRRDDIEGGKESGKVMEGDRIKEERKRGERRMEKSKREGKGQIENSVKSGGKKELKDRGRRKGRMEGRGAGRGEGRKRRTMYGGEGRRGKRTGEKSRRERKLGSSGTHAIFWPRISSGGRATDPASARQALSPRS